MNSEELINYFISESKLYIEHIQKPNNKFRYFVYKQSTQFKISCNIIYVLDKRGEEWYNCRTLSLEDLFQVIEDMKIAEL